MSKDKYYANKGIKRNKKPLQNIVYKIELTELSDFTNPKDYYEYKFKDLGYISVNWKYEKQTAFYWSGLHTVDELKKLLGEKQYAKFCNGKREFIIQRRFDGKNI